ncbi:hypothetical protein [Actinacidiphila glaucinigra]|uniref:hypothetical protein n=1 Tax=Actinacidiphila glaucinigra TaxID=235986 RepID=UPI003D8CB48A
MPGRHMPGVLPWHGFLDAEITVRSGFARSLEPCLDPDDLAPGPRPWRRRPPGRTPGGRTTGATLGSGSNTPGKAAPGSADVPAGLIQHSALGLRSDSWFIVRGGRVARRMQISGPHSEIPSPPMADRSRSSAWQHVAGVAPLEELPMMAAHALADGDDSPALRELAGLSRRDDPAEIRELYDRALSELGIMQARAPRPGTGARPRLTAVEVANEPFEAAARTPEETDFLATAAVYSKGPLPALPPDTRPNPSPSHCGKSMVARVDIGRGCRYGFSCSPERQKGLAETNCRSAVPAVQLVAVCRTVRWWSCVARVVAGRRTGLTAGPGGPQ